MNISDRVIIALDLDDRRSAEGIVEEVGDLCGTYKIGLQLLTAAGPDLISHLVAAGKNVFLDLKLFEIPNSVAGAVRAAGELGVGMVTVHALGGRAILAAAVEAARAYPALRVLALTVVTSMTDDDLADIGVAGTTQQQVLRLSGLAQRAGCHGVVASPQEVAALRAALGTAALLVTPGVGLPGGPVTEHSRSDTPRAAIAAGASHIVLGRSVTRSPDPRAVLARIHDTIAP